VKVDCPNDIIATLTFSSRIDRLGSILLMDFFPYYQHWPFNERRWSKEYITLTRKGHDLLEGNWIYHYDNIYMVLAIVLVIIFL
jgi:hypothetical protein